VTIIAGFRTPEGIVVCGDTQETVTNLSKKSVQKVKVEPWHLNTNLDRGAGIGLAASFCGAGDGAFIDKMIALSWKSAESANSLDEACDRIETKIKDTYREYGTIFQTGACPSVELIYGVKAEYSSRLFFARGPIVTEQEGYCSGGAGYYMADFLASRLRSGFLSLHQCVILAAYILFQAKEHVDGCGGESHIAVLRHKGRSGLVHWARVKAITDLLEAVDRNIGTTLLAAADLRSTVDIPQAIDTLTQAIRYYRNRADLELKEYDIYGESFLPSGQTDKDDLGFVLNDGDIYASELDPESRPSTSQKSEEPQ